jgi:hypothetical protein
MASSMMICDGTITTLLIGIRPNQSQGQLLYGTTRAD